MFFSKKWELLELKVTAGKDISSFQEVARVLGVFRNNEKYKSLNFLICCWPALKNFSDTSRPYGSYGEKYENRNTTASHIPSIPAGMHTQINLNTFKII